MDERIIKIKQDRLTFEKFYFILGYGYRFKGNSMKQVKTILLDLTQI